MAMPRPHEAVTCLLLQGFTVTRKPYGFNIFLSKEIMGGRVTIDLNVNTAVYTWHGREDTAEANDIHVVLINHGIAEVRT